MLTKTIRLNNEEGLHARAAALFVRLANTFTSEISISSQGEKVNGKSIIGIMSLGVFSGEEVTIMAEGEDQEEAIDKLVGLIENNFINV